MIQDYAGLTRLEMEQLDKEKTIVMIPLGPPSSTAARLLWEQT